MINSNYLYLLLVIACILLFYLFINFRSSKNEINSKVLLKNLLEGLDIELPEELKALDN